MTQINLLPWRENLREERKREFLVMLGGACAFTALLMFFSHMMVNGWVAHQQERNLMVQQEINLLNEKITEIREIKKEKEALLTRMDIIQDLQHNRAKIVHIFDEVVEVLPHGIYLQTIKREGDVITLLGHAESNTNVSDLMRSVSSSPWLAEPVLNEIKTDDVDGQRKSDFKLQLIHKKPAQQTTKKEEQSGA